MSLLGAQAARLQSAVGTWLWNKNAIAFKCRQAACAPGKMHLNKVILGKLYVPAR